MPRPGPRPYECVRRAWHSDRHQPIRGSLIREIFRVANESHRPATRKNKEWQEKIPSVVLKAEEIMYSKANSEAEYVDLGTLLDRINDAIDTIIRRDDSAESGGHLLQPCIEAALTLGCIPRRASRSERHNRPTCYLSGPGTQEVTETSTSSLNVNNSNRSQRATVPGLLQPMLPAYARNLRSASTGFRAWYSTISCPPAMTDGGHLEMGSVNLDVSVNLNNSMPISCSAIQFPSDDCPFYKREKNLLETCEQANLGRIYPLYYGDILHNMESCSSFQEPLGSSYDVVTIDSASYISSVREIDMQNFVGTDNGCNFGNEKLDLQDICESAADVDHDLSLQLGLPSITYLGADDGLVPEVEVEDMGSSSSHSGINFHVMPFMQCNAINF
uniref:Histone acetyltransferase p300 n=1 Tax=Anthurium amnicola TaxID=1678845 RepID=A0A1D1XQU8_9ARAE